MGWLAPATFGCFAAAGGVLCYVLVGNIEPQPEYPELMTDLIRLLGAAIALGGLLVGAAFLRAAVTAYPV